jgi:hypothetical protein
MAPDTVVVEALFVRLPEDSDRAQLEAFANMEESFIDIELRRELDRNGIRAGIILGEIPKQVQHWLAYAEARKKSDLMEQVDLNSDVSTLLQRLQCRAGKRKVIDVHPEKATSLSVFYHDGSPKGKTYESPAFQFALTTLPNGDGTANVRLVPEIQYGPPALTFVPRDFAIRKESRRRQDHWDNLALEAKLQMGQILVVGGTSDPRGLGEHFFWANRVDGGRDRVILLLRLAQTQLDDILSPDLSAQAKKEAELHP